MDKEHIKGALAEASENWMRDFKGCHRFWTSAATEPKFWSMGADMCITHGIPARMLIPLVHNHLNDLPSEVTVKFHCNVMRAQGLMERSIEGCRAHLKEALDDLKQVSMISGLTNKPSNSILETFRALAELTLENYRIGLKVLFATSGVRDNDNEVAEHARELIRYRCCEENPFLLMDQAKLPLNRHAAYNNIQALLRYQPWVRDIWEGTVGSGYALDNEMEMAGPRPDPYPYEGPNWSWPPSPFAGYVVKAAPVHPVMGVPKMYVNRPLFQQQVSAYLSIKADEVRRANPHMG